MRVLALHGNMGSLRDYDFLSDLDWVEPVDLWPLAHLSFDRAAESIYDLAIQHNCRAVMGYSMGGRLALRAIADHPNFWQQAYILSTHPGLESEAEASQRVREDRLWQQKLNQLDWSDFLQIWNDRSVLNGPTPDTQFHLKAYRQPIAAAMVNWSLGVQGDLRQSIACYPGQMIWITGSKDSKFSLLADQLDTVEKIQIPHCGHRLLIEAREELREILYTHRQE